MSKKRTKSLICHHPYPLNANKKGTNRAAGETVNFLAIEASMAESIDVIRHGLSNLIILEFVII